MRTKMQQNKISLWGIVKATPRRKSTALMSMLDERKNPNSVIKFHLKNPQREQQGNSRQQQKEGRE
jgi:hypothetical protein